MIEDNPTSTTIVSLQPNYDEKWFATLFELNQGVPLFTVKTFYFIINDCSIYSIKLCSITAFTVDYYVILKAPCTLTFLIKGDCFYCNVVVTFVMHKYSNKYSFVYV